MLTNLWIVRYFLSNRPFAISVITGFNRLIKSFFNIWKSCSIKIEPTLDVTWILKVLNVLATDVFKLDEFEMVNCY